jgi:hypothetical protein
MPNKIFVYGPVGSTFDVSVGLMEQHVPSLTIPDPAGTKRNKTVTLQWTGRVVREGGVLVPFRPVETSWEEDEHAAKVGFLAYESEGCPVMSIVQSMYPGMGKAIRVRSDDCFAFMDHVFRANGMTDLERHDTHSIWLPLLSSQPQVLINFPVAEFCACSSLTAQFPTHPEQSGKINAVRMFFVASPLPPDVREYGYDDKGVPTIDGPWPLWNVADAAPLAPEPPERGNDWFGIVQILGSFAPPPLASAFSAK